jgi:hypothetical protein
MAEGDNDETVRWHTLGIPEHPSPEERTFVEWIEEGHRGEEQQAWCRQWHLEREVAEGEASAVVMRKAAERLFSAWVKRGHKHRKTEMPPKALVQSMVGRRLLPTLTAQAADRYYLPGLRRYMSAEEICAAFGVGGALKMALLVEEERLTGSAARMLGAAIDIDVMEVVLRAALSKAGMLERAAEDGLTMGDVCSGIGTMAAAASRVTGGKLRYVFAAEKEAGKRRVLKAAWGAQGLQEEGAVKKEALDEGAMTAIQESVDVYGMTPDCGRWSRLTRDGGGEQPGRSMAAVREMERMLAYAIARQPAIVIMESVDNLQQPGKEREYGEAINPLAELI